MKERPILMSSPMVRALLAGTKTQTRRIIKNVPAFVGDENNSALGHAGEFVESLPCPYGVPGDRLWVRESFWEAGDYHSVGDSGDCYRWNGGRRYSYAADGAPPNEPNSHYPNGLRNGSYAAAEPNKLWRRLPSIHMPRCASRITLELTAVRVERLNDISEADAKAEGCNFDEWTYPQSFTPGKTSYRVLWNSINGPDAWDKNPWVWVLNFRKI